MDIGGIILLVMMVALVLAMIYLVSGLSVAEIYRRKKHPIWYGYYDRAVHNSFSIGERLKDKTDIINKCITATQEAYKKGECTVDEFRGLMKINVNDYIKAVTQYHKDFVNLKIDEDLRAADAYAKEHNWKFGYLYDDIELLGQLKK